MLESIISTLRQTVWYRCVHWIVLQKMTLRTRWPKSSYHAKCEQHGQWTWIVGHVSWHHQAFKVFTSLTLFVSPSRVFHRRVNTPKPIECVSMLVNNYVIDAVSVFVYNPTKNQTTTQEVWHKEVREDLVRWRTTRGLSQGPKSPPPTTLPRTQMQSFFSHGLMYIHWHWIINCTSDSENLFSRQNSVPTYPDHPMCVCTGQNNVPRNFAQRSSLSEWDNTFGRSMYWVFLPVSSIEFWATIRHCRRHSGLHALCSNQQPYAHLGQGSEGNKNKKSRRFASFWNSIVHKTEHILGIFAHFIDKFPRGGSPQSPHRQWQLRPSGIAPESTTLQALDGNPQES